MDRQFKADIKNLCVRIVGGMAKGIKINNIVVLAVMSPAYLAFVWTTIRFKLTAMAFSQSFFLKPLLHIDGHEKLFVVLLCSAISLFALFPLCRILQLSFPETFEPFADSTNRDD